MRPRGVPVKSPQRLNSPIPMRS